MDYKKYTIEEDLAPYISPWGQEQILPNWKPMGLVEFCQLITHFGGLTPYIGHPGLKVMANDYRTRRGRLFLTYGQFSGWDGGGYAIVDTGYQREPVAGSWAICKHEAKEHAGANHSRGWHPASCRLCGYDMTVDSGD